MVSVPTPTQFYVRVVFGLNREAMQAMRGTLHLEEHSMEVESCKGKAHDVAMHFRLSRVFANVTFTRLNCAWCCDKAS